MFICQEQLTMLICQEHLTMLICQEHLTMLICQEHLTMLICQARTPTCRLRLPTNYNQGKLLNTQSFMIDGQKIYYPKSP